MPPSSPLMRNLRVFGGKGGGKGDELQVLEIVVAVVVVVVVEKLFVRTQSDLAKAGDSDTTS